MTTSGKTHVIILLSVKVGMRKTQSFAGEYIY